MKNVTLIATGGTIASTAERAGGPVNANVAAHRLLDSLHERPDGITVQVEDFEAVGSYALDLETVHRLCTRIGEVLAEDAVDGVVVTHGTDTMEESAFLADLLVRSDKPVVFTGAQRHAGAPDTDGPRNIADAIRCAASEGLRGQGAVILFEGELHAAREVTKAHSSRVDTFRSPGLGKLGEVDDGAVYLYRRSLARSHVEAPMLDPGVELILLGLGSTPDYLDYCASAGKSGVVLSAFGRGNAPSGFAERIARLTEAGVPVVVASRCAEGRTLPVYGKDSGGRTLQEAGVIFAGSLSPIKARLLLSALLGGGAGDAEIRAAFEAAGGLV
ncbi:asparaginase [Thioclava sp. IC9]|uniref:asparaginase n=1 Tax=Thioclava sp. IC9 TaxID=1973007 RepID=UPI000B543D77|nr:asparaginase [Thioclava sp. IC9]OWY06327.1 L-asparaginase [Thioclava sp. IC9]